MGPCSSKAVAVGLLLTDLDTHGFVKRFFNIHIVFTKGSSLEGVPHYEFPFNKPGVTAV